MRFLLPLICLLSFSALNSQDNSNYEQAFQFASVWLEAQKDYEKLPGISAIAVRDQEELWSAGFGLGNMEKGISANPETNYSICSISKLFTSVGIMILYDEGKLRLDDRIEDVLPWYDLAQQFGDSGPITIRTMLTHSSGLPRESNHPYWSWPDFPFPSIGEVKSELKNQETLYPASTYFQYSNLAMTLLGAVIEEVSGMNYADFIRSRIIEPLGLDHTQPFMPEEDYGEELSIGYSALSRTGERQPVSFFQADGIAAAAGFTSNVKDLGKFASWQFRLLDSEKSEILKPATLKLMHNIHYTDPSGRPTWGLGFSVYKDQKGNTTVGHGGSCPGYRTQLSIYPKEELAFSVMVNAGGTNPSKYIIGIKGIMDKLKSTESAPGPDVSLEDYTGFYNQQPWGSESFIGVWEDKLVALSLPSESPAESMTILKHVEGDTFKRIAEDNTLRERITFNRDAEGKIISYTQHTTIYGKINEM